MFGGWLILYMLHPSPLHLTQIIYYSDVVNDGTHQAVIVQLIRA